MSLGLPTRASSGRRRAMRSLGGAVSLGLQTTASSGRRVIGAGSSGGSTGRSRVNTRSKMVHFKRTGL